MKSLPYVEYFRLASPNNVAHEHVQKSLLGIIIHYDYLCRLQILNTAFMVS
jgi:hypothetical protein